MTYQTVFTLPQILAQIDSGEHWSSNTISFSFAPSLAPENAAETATFSRFGTAQEAAARKALSLWADVANITFSDLGISNDGDLRFHNAADAGTAYAYLPGIGSGGDLFFNPRFEDVLNPAEGGYGFMTYLHEIGHALGLDHPGPYNGTASYTVDAVYQQDTLMYTLMSYFDATLTGADHFSTTDQYAETPLLHDIATIQAIYGANTATRTGNTIYGFNSTAGLSAFDFTTNPDPVIAIWDAGGVDTLDFSGFDAPTMMSLGEGTFSNTPGMLSNVAIAFGVTIENGAGGSAADLMFGNDAGNVLTGNGGDDILNGRGGADTLRGGAGNDTLDGGAGIDTLEGGADDDTYVLGADSDTVVDTGGVDTVTSSITRSLTSFTGIENLTLTGSGIANATGDGNVNVLIGNNAANAINGGAGADRMEGGLGNDVYYLDNAGDVIVEFTGEGTDTAFTSVNLRLDLMTTAQPLEYVILQGTTNLTVVGSATFNGMTGNSGNNYIAGYGGNDTLNGAAGNDLVYGGDGKDTMTGGNGDDRFYYNFIAESGGTQPRRDVITDFSQVTGNNDWIDLAATDANGVLAGNQAFVWLGTAAFTGAVGELRYFQDVAANKTIIEGNVRSDANSAGPELSIELNGLYTLTAGATNVFDIIL